MTTSSLRALRMSGRLSGVVRMFGVCVLLLTSGLAAAADQEPPTQPTPPQEAEAGTAASAAPAAPVPDTRPSAAPAIGATLLDDAGMAGTSGDELSSIELAIQAREIDSAKAELNAYIEQIENATHRYAPELVRPLVVLGDAHMAAGEFEQATDSYGRALHIDRVASGLHSPSQAAIVYKEADALAALGDLAAANDRELYAFEVQLREHHPDSMDMLPAAFRLADWHLKTHNVLMARALYQQAERTLVLNDSLRGAPALRALRGIALTYRMERFPPIYRQVRSEQVDGATDFPARPFDDNTGYRDDAVLLVNNFPQGERALNRVANMLREDPAASALDQANSLTDLADWYLLFDRPERATPLYVEARRLLTEAGLPQANRFASAEALYFPEPPPLRAPAPDDRDALRTGRVKVGFTVTASGDINNLVTLEVQPESNMEYRVRRSMRAARYRPPLVEGALAEATGQTFLYEYRYYPKKAAAPQPEPPLKPATGKPGDAAPRKAG